MAEPSELLAAGSTPLGATYPARPAPLLPTHDARSRALERLREQLGARDLTLWSGSGQLLASASETRVLLLAQPERVTLAPLMESLLLPRNAGNEKLWLRAQWPASTLRDVLDKFVLHCVHRVYIVDDHKRPLGVVTMSGTTRAVFDVLACMG